MTRRILTFFLFFTMLSFSGFAQDDDRKNKKPKIEGQRNVSIAEDGSYTIQLMDLQVRDPDDWFYPWGFTLQVYDGDNYARSGATITPKADYSGTLTVRVTVHDGEDFSEPFNFKISVTPVNDRPVIISQTTLLSVQEEKPLTLSLSHLNVQDVDNPYPNGFSLTVSPGNQYSVSGTTITPVRGSVGTLSVTVRVSDGQAQSDPFDMKVTVLAGNAQPRIVGHTDVTTSEDTPFRIEWTHLVVQDADSRYPDDFQLKIEAAGNYSVDKDQIIPKKNFFGTLQVKVIVNDKFSDSPPYYLPVEVRSVNDAPEVIAFDHEPLPYEPGQGRVKVSEIFEAIDAENDSIVKAEIGFLSGQYRVGNDELTIRAANGIEASFDVRTGVLTLSGRASAARYSEVIKTLEYNYVTIIEPIRENKTVFIRLSDGESTGEVTRIIQSAELIADLDIPSAFTPNGDSANDTWIITPLRVSEEVENAIVRVYTKHGVLLFETQGFENPWDGKYRGEHLPADSYYYTIDFNLKYTKNTLKGIVTILR